MRERVSFSPERVLPDRDRVLAQQGIPNEAEVGRRTRAVAESALEQLRCWIEPVGLVATISGEDFARVYKGEGNNDPRTPLGAIFPRAAHLALFAVTLGEPVCSRIAGLFRSREFALATMLDAAASEATETTGDELERWFRRRLNQEVPSGPWPVLRYSPGYCGWHLSGQRALFGFLRPAEIGISLRASFLMEPLKSMTGVMVAGPAEIHVFRPDFSFCESCRTHSCRHRMRAVTTADPKPGS